MVDPTELLCFQFSRIYNPWEAENKANLLASALPQREIYALAKWFSNCLTYQLRWILDNSRAAAMLKGRQIGASHASACAAVLWAFWQEDTYIISTDEKTATDVLEKAWLAAKALEGCGSLLGKPKKRTQTEILFENGAKVKVLPSTSAARGYSGNVILDEAAYYGRTVKPADVWDGAAAATIHGHKLRVQSTPNGVGNWFHQFWTTDRSKNYQKYVITLDQAIRDGIHTLSGLAPDAFREHIFSTLAQNDKRLFAQLAQCSFLDSEDQLIPTESIENCQVNNCQWPEGPYYAGLDIGRTADRTELVIVRVAPDGTRWLMKDSTKGRTDVDDIFSLADTAFGHPYYCKKLCVDATGLGAFPAENLQKRYGAFRVEPVVFTLKSKEELATGMALAFNTGTVRIPKADDKLFKELCSIRREVTDAGNVRYDAPHTPEGHADKAWALALALYGCSKPLNQMIDLGPSRW